MLYDSGRISGYPVGLWKYDERFPYPVRRFFDAVGPMLGLLMAMCLVFPLSMLVRCAAPFCPTLYSMAQGLCCSQQSCRHTPGTGFDLQLLHQHLVNFN